MNFVLVLTPECLHFSSIVIYIAVTVCKDIMFLATINVIGVYICTWYVCHAPHMVRLCANVL